MAGWAWRRQLLGCEALCAQPAGDLVVAACIGGASIEAMTAAAGSTVWRRGPPLGSASVLSVALSPSNVDGGRLALGTELAQTYIWRAATAEPLAHFALTPSAEPPLRSAPTRRISRVGGMASEAQWVELVQWSGDGLRIAVAAGRDVAIAMLSGEMVAQQRAGSTVYALDFPSHATDASATTSDGGNNGSVHPAALAFGAYGGIGWVVERAPSARHEPALKIGATAVLSVSVSCDRYLLAAGCLDKRVRIFPLGETRHGAGACDWVGFEGAVVTLAWSGAGDWLAAMGGRTLLAVRRDLRSGEAPTLLCVARGGAAAQPVMAVLCWGVARSGRQVLMATEALTCRTHLFDVTQAADCVPRRASPILTIDSPGGHCLEDSVVPRQPWLACVSMGCAGNGDGREDGSWPFDPQFKLLVSDGQTIGASMLNVWT